uniref:Uncharacterized protein n=1 Tax=Ditylenchus dipsaci TaxID=166011 RepID=A0A915DUV2_9BILA
MDSENGTHARQSAASLDCVYMAQVADSTQSSIVNLCDRHGGVQEQQQLYAAVHQPKEAGNSGGGGGVEPTVTGQRKKKREREFSENHHPLCSS